MFEYEIYNKATNEHYFLYGYSYNDAWKRNHTLKRDDWELIHSEYID